MEKYGGTVLILDAEGNEVYARELTADQVIDELVSALLNARMESLSHRLDKVEHQIEEHPESIGATKEQVKKAKKKAVKVLKKREPKQEDTDPEPELETEEWSGKARCKHSAQGLENLKPRHPDRLGYIVGKGRKGELRVVWDGTKIPTNYHPDFIEQLPPGFVAREGISKEDLKREEEEQEKRRADAKLKDLQNRITRCVKGGLSADEILGSPAFKKEDRRTVEEMIAWAQKDNA